MNISKVLSWQRSRRLLLVIREDGVYINITRKEQLLIPRIRELNKSKISLYHGGVSVKIWAYTYPQMCVISDTSVIIYLHGTQKRSEFSTKIRLDASEVEHPKLTDAVSAVNNVWLNQVISGVSEYHLPTKGPFG